MHRLYRHHCLERRHGPGSRDVHHFKDLTALGRDLSRTLIVDDTPRVGAPRSMLLPSSLFRPLIMGCLLALP